MLDDVLGRAFAAFFCRYKAFRDSEGNYTLFYFQLLAVQFAFVVIFEVIINLGLH